MDFLFKSALSQDDILKIDCLERDNNNYCVFHDGDDFGFPAYFFAFEKEHLVGFLSLLPNSYTPADGGRPCCDVAALVDAPFRRNGIFTQMLLLAHKTAPAFIFLLGYGQNAAFDITATSLVRELVYSDLFLTLSKDRAVPQEFSFDSHLWVKHKNNRYRLFITDDSGKGRAIGTVNLSSVRQFTNIWGVEIKKPHRRKGYGFMLMSYVIHDYFKSHSKPLLLHVESSNKAAVNLYHKLNFVTYTRIDNYRV